MCSFNGETSLHQCSLPYLRYRSRGLAGLQMFVYLGSVVCYSAVNTARSLIRITAYSDQVFLSRLTVREHIFVVALSGILMVRA